MKKNYLAQATFFQNGRRNLRLFHFFTKIYTLGSSLVKTENIAEKVYFLHYFIHLYMFINSEYI